jgi:hypothetical protein
MEKKVSLKDVNIRQMVGKTKLSVPEIRVIILGDEYVPKSIKEAEEAMEVFGKESEVGRKAIKMWDGVIGAKMAEILAGEDLSKKISSLSRLWFNARGLSRIRDEIGVKQNQLWLKKIEMLKDLKEWKKAIHSVPVGSEAELALFLKGNDLLNNVDDLCKEIVGIVKTRTYSRNMEKIIFSMWDKVMGMIKIEDVPAAVKVFESFDGLVNDRLLFLKPLVEKMLVFYNISDEMLKFQGKALLCRFGNEFDKKLTEIVEQELKLYNSFNDVESYLEKFDSNDTSAPEAVEKMVLKKLISLISDEPQYKRARGIVRHFTSGNDDELLGLLQAKSVDLISEEIELTDDLVRLKSIFHDDSGVLKIKVANKWDSLSLAKVEKAKNTKELIEACGSSRFGSEARKEAVLELALRFQKKSKSHRQKTR